MFTKFVPRAACVLVFLAIPALVSCDKLGKLKAVTEKQEKGKSAGAVEASLPVGQRTYSRDQVSEVDQAGYPAFIARGNALVIVDFNATWCGPCKMMGPVLDKAAEQHPGVVYLGKVDVDKVPQLAAAQGVRGIPDVRFFKNGKEVDRFVGFPGEATVLEKISSLAAGISPPAATAGAVSAAQPEMQPFSKGWLPPGMSKGHVKAPQGQ